VRRAPDVASLVAGLALAGLGAVLLADRLGAFELRFATFGPLACAVAGTILLAIGLSRRT
jgi:hypothetical protein